MATMEDQLQMILRRQSELEQALLGEQAARVSAQGEVEAIKASMTSTANGPPGLRDDRHIGFVDTKILGKPDKFDDMDTSWKDLRFVVRAYFLAAMPGIDLLLDLAEGTDQEIENIDFDERETPASRSSCTTCCDVDQGSCTRQGSVGMGWRRRQSLARNALAVGTADKDPVDRNARTDLDEEIRRRHPERARELGETHSRV